ncbi:hypothetical protein AK85_04920 [Streptococcus pneumoniae B1598]|nr:hypothetical protein AK85_04920 [Streptococcus pneumoniae B1598]
MAPGQLQPISDLVVKKDDATGSVTVTVQQIRFRVTERLQQVLKQEVAMEKVKERTFYNNSCRASSTNCFRSDSSSEWHTKCRNRSMRLLQLLRKLVAVAAEALKQVAAGSNTEIPVYSYLCGWLTENRSVGSIL